MRHRVATALALACVICLAFVGLLRAEDAEGEVALVKNEMCPVMTDESADAQFNLPYHGKLVYFCCDQCADKFAADPDKYIKNLPDGFLEKSDNEDLYTGVESGGADWSRDARLVPGVALAAGLLLYLFSGRGRRLWLQHAAFCSLLAGVVSTAATLHAMNLFHNYSLQYHLFNQNGKIGYACSLLMAVFLTLIRIWHGRSSLAPGFSQRRFVVALIGCLCIYCYVGWRTLPDVYRDTGHEYSPAEQLRRRHLDILARYGNPPRPEHPPVPRTLSAVYYRGNDERSETLFNNGNYRTCTFHLSVLEPDGTPAAPGRTRAGTPLRVEILIEPAKNIRKNFFTDEGMKNYFVTPQFHPGLGDKVTVRDFQKYVEEEGNWVARIPVPLSETRRNRLSGVLYLCQGGAVPADAVPVRYHYGVQYDLSFDKAGVLTADSDLWMSAFFKPGNAINNHLKDEEWLSWSDPIPEKPEPFEEENDATDDKSGAETVQPGSEEEK